MTDETWPLAEYVVVNDNDNVQDSWMITDQDHNQGRHHFNAEAQAYSDDSTRCPEDAVPRPKRSRTLAENYSKRLKARGKQREERRVELALRSRFNKTDLVITINVVWEDEEVVSLGDLAVDISTGLEIEQNPDGIR